MPYNNGIIFSRDVERCRGRHLTARKISYRKGQNNIGIICCIAFVATLLLLPQVMARPSYLSTFESTYPEAAGSRIDACNLCHKSPEGGDARNLYGLSFASSGRKFAAIEDTDSDKDGYANLQEIKSLTFPGDVNDHPTTTPPPKSPGFEAIGTIASLFVVVMAIVYRQRKGKH